MLHIVLSPEMCILCLVALMAAIVVVTTNGGIPRD